MKDDATPRDIKVQLRRGSIILPKRYPDPDISLSKFQRKRLRRSFRVVDQFLRGDKTVTELAEIHGVRYQRICQVLAFGISYLLKVGWFGTPTRRAA